MSALKYWLWLSALTALTPRRRFALLAAFGEPEAAYFAEERQLRELLSPSEAELRLMLDKSLDRTEQILEACRTKGIDILTYQDALYPQRLKNITDPPVVLYSRGRLPAFDEEAAIGVVGTRKASPYGIKMGKKLGFELIRGGGLVITGLADGVDAAAAEGALRAGGSCVGILGCAIDNVYPQYSTELYADVAAAGVLISEYPPAEPTSRKNFPERNRIISGLSVGVVIIEAPEKSGALITASRALDQGREVFAVPGNVDALGCVGSNSLIREGATLVTKGWDVLMDFEHLFPGKLAEPDARRLAEETPAETEKPVVYPSEEAAPPQKLPPETGQGFFKLRVRTDRKKIDNDKKREYIDLREQLSELSERQLKIVSAMDETSVHVDDIIEKTALSAPEVLSELTILQIKGFVSQESGKRFSLNLSGRPS